MPTVCVSPGAPRTETVGSGAEPLGGTLRQTPLGIALTGDTTRYTGPARSLGYRWFTDPTARALYHPDDHVPHPRVFAAGLRTMVTLLDPDQSHIHTAIPPRSTSAQVARR